jgi:glycosyltransferase involved in cell wall biosynthesis
VLAVGTFHNPGWFRSHARPLVDAGVRDVEFVADVPPAQVEGVRFACPSARLTGWVGRTMAKLIVAARRARQNRPDWVMGYHLFPGALSALLVARLCGARACYQMTAGPVEIEGGGYQNENRIMACLMSPRRWLERLALHVAGEFDLVVVRGERARAFLAKRGITKTTVIPGSIAPVAGPQSRRNYDLVFVGRLTAFKQPLQFLEIVDKVGAQLPGIRAAVVGEGPLLETMRIWASKVGSSESQGRVTVDVMGSMTDPESVLADAKVFVLTSRSEGLSIALIEAMAHGVVPVVADVGELRDLVADDRTGYVVPPNDLDAYTARIVALLRDPGYWSRLSQAASGATEGFRVGAIARRWRQALGLPSPATDDAPVPVTEPARRRRRSTNRPTPRAKVARLQRRNDSRRSS